MNAVGTAALSSAPLSGAAANQRKIQDAIKQYVLTNGLAPGDPMPTEPELMAMLKISRNALREAMKALQALGFIEIRHGFGTYVGKPNLESLQAGLTFRMQRSVAGDLAEVSNLLTVRQALEIGLAEEVVDHYHSRDLDRLERIVAAMESEAEVGREFLEHDLAFHVALYEPLGNALVQDLLQVFWRSFHAIDPELPGPDYSPTDAAGWHRRLVEAIEVGDPALYADRMRDHFGGVRVRLQKKKSQRKRAT